MSEEATTTNNSTAPSSEPQQNQPGTSVQASNCAVTPEGSKEFFNDLEGKRKKTRKDTKGSLPPTYSLAKHHEKVDELSDREDTEEEKEEGTAMGTSYPSTKGRDLASGRHKLGNEAPTALKDRKGPIREQDYKKVSRNETPTEREKGVKGFARGMRGMPKDSITDEKGGMMTKEGKDRGDKTEMTKQPLASLKLTGESIPPNITSLQWGKSNPFKEYHLQSQKIEERKEEEWNDDDEDYYYYYDDDDDDYDDDDDDYEDDNNEDDLIAAPGTINRDQFHPPKPNRDYFLQIKRTEMNGKKVEWPMQDYEMPEEGDNNEEAIQDLEEMGDNGEACGKSLEEASTSVSKRECKKAPSKKRFHLLSFILSKVIFNSPYTRFFS